MNIHIDNSIPENKNPKVIIQIECEPEFAQEILALAMPLATSSDRSLNLSVLPEALLQCKAWWE